MTGPLEGVNVLEFCTAGVGPWGTSLLGHLGANVVKIEPPQGEAMIHQPPEQAGLSVIYTSCNFSTRNVKVDLVKNPRAVDHLVREADVLVENMRPGKMEKLGLGYTRAHELNPHLVYVTSPGWGSEGPMVNMPAIDGHVQMFSGFAALNGEPSIGPEMFRHPHMDWNSGAYLAAAMLVGLLARERSGESQFVRLSHIGAGITMQISRIAEFFATGEQPQLLGSAAASSAPHEAFLCQDKQYLAVGVVNDKQWRGLCRALGHTEWADDPRWQTNRDRVARRAELAGVLAPVFSAYPARWWVIQLAKQGVPHSTFFDHHALLYHTQVLENGYIQEIEMPHQGRFLVGGVPWHFSQTPANITPAPAPGEDTEDVLRDGFGRPGLLTHRGWELRGETARLDAPEASAGLAGSRVVDLSQGLCGPYLSLLLAECGAEVIKVEPPDGDYARQFAPADGTGDSAAFVQLNHNKKSVTLNLEDDAARQSLRDLLRSADVLVEDLGPAERLRLGLSAEEVHRLNPALVQCSLTAYGERGPLANVPGAELPLQAASEYWASLGEIGAPPVRVGADIASINTATEAFTGVLAALAHRLTSGQGQQVAVSMLGTLMHMRGAQWAAISDPDEWWGFYCDTYTKPRFQGAQTQDLRVYFNLFDATEEQYLQLLIELGMEELILDPRFGAAGRNVTGMGRYAHEVIHLWEERFQHMPAQDVISLFRGAGGMAVELNTYERLFDHPQVRLLDLVRTVDVPGQGLMKVLAPPWSIESTRVAPTPPPRLGQHNAELLKEGQLVR